jgi:hypothetical protein
MKPSQFKRLEHTKYPELKEASSLTFDWLAETSEIHTNCNVKALLVSYQANLKIVRRDKPHTIGEEFYIYITNSVAQEPEGSSPHSQQPATGPCPEPVESNPHAPSQPP